MVFLGFRISRTGPTERYPYGLDRADDLAGIGIAVVIWASAAFAGYESIRKLAGHGPTSHVALGIAGAALGIIGNQVVARYKALHRQEDQLGDPGRRRPALVAGWPVLPRRARRPGRGRCRLPVG